MAVCFICNSKLHGERTRVCSSITPHSNSPYPEKIGELMGEDFVIIVTPADHMCKRCTSLLIHIDKLENDLKLVKNAMLSYVQKKYGLLPADQPVTSIEVVNGNLRTDELEIGQKRVPSGFTVRDPSTIAGGSSGSNTPSKTRQEASKIKIYKCGFCSFQSKELGHVRFHMRTHMKKKDNEKSNQAVTKTVTQQQQPQQQQHQNQTQQLKCLPNKQQPQKKKLYRCQVCSASFDSRSDCLDHIQRDHNQQQPTSTTQEPENLQQETNVTMEETASVFQPHNTLNSIENQQDVIKTEDDSHLADDKHTMDTDLDMLLKDSIPDENSEVPIQETQNIMSEQTELMQPNQEIPVANVDISDMVIGGGETDTDHLDIESMLAAIHNDVVSPPNDGGNAQNFL